MPTIKNMLSWNLAQCSPLKALVLYLYEWSRHGITPICWSCSTLCPTSLKPTWLRFGSRSFGSCCFFRVRTARAVHLCHPTRQVSRHFHFRCDISQQNRPEPMLWLLGGILFWKTNTHLCVCSPLHIELDEETQQVPKMSVQQKWQWAERKRPEWNKMIWK